MYLDASPSETFEIQGRVADEDDSPLAGVAVALTGSQSVSTMTDASGLYHFSNLPTSGVYNVNISKHDYDFAAPSQTFTTPATDVRYDFAATLQRHTVSGRVTKADGSPLAGALVALMGSQVSTATTGADGTYAFPNSVAVTINDNDTDPMAANAIDDAEFFVRQHYRDFLNREPDAVGLAFWTKQITSCGADAGCREVKRINVSAAFFLSIEFQETGFFVYKTYRAAYGQRPDRLGEFTLDARDVSAGVVVGETGWEQQLELNKAAYVADFVARAKFEETFPLSLTPAQFVSALDANAGNSLTPSEQEASAAEFGGAQDTANLTARACCGSSSITRPSTSARRIPPSCSCSTSATCIASRTSRASTSGSRSPKTSAATTAAQRWSRLSSLRTSTETASEGECGSACERTGRPPQLPRAPRR